MMDRIYLVLAGGHDYVESYTLRSGPDEIEVDASGYRAFAALGFRLGIP
jgi:hypothetical protein